MLAFLGRTIRWMHEHPVLAFTVWFTLLVQLVRKIAAPFLYGIIFDQGFGAGDGHALVTALIALAILLSPSRQSRFCRNPRWRNSASRSWTPYANGCFESFWPCPQLSQPVCAE